MTNLDKGKYYQETIGRIPPEISDRIDVGLEADPKLTEMFEELRMHILTATVLDKKTVQVMLFGMMAAKLIEAPTRYHAAAARAEGATKEELYAVAGLALLVGGMRSFNIAGAAIAEAFRDVEVR